MGAVSRMMPRVIDRADFADYLRQSEPAQKVIPAFAFAEDLKRRMFSPQARTDGLLPWSKTHSNFAFRSGEVTLWAGINGYINYYNKEKTHQGIGRQSPESVYRQVA